MEESSAFFSPQESTPERASRRLVHTSEKGYFEIWRIDRMGRFRALKCLKAEYRGERLYEDLLRKEFEIGYSLRHPGIVEYYGFTQEEGLGNCIEMEWVDGCTLAALKEQGPLKKELEERILDELCDALSYLHARGVVHRDLKPSNVLVTHADYHVRLIDFSFSDTSAHSILKASAGTVSYAAPEVLEGGKADARSDIYSLGLLIYFLSRRHNSVARKCCERRPQHRYASAQEVKKALHSRSPLWAGILFIILVLFAVLWPMLPKKAEPQPVQIQADSAITSQDTITAPQLPAQKSTVREKAAPAAKEVAVDTALIDDLFRQATDLFD